MDIRKERTKRSIYNAFIELRSKKPLEKLTVKELCEKAEINKSTFYVYYNDVYDLSEVIEDEIVTSVIKSIERPRDVIDNPKNFTRSLFIAYESQSSLISTVFSGSRSECLPRKIERALKNTLFEIYPNYSESMEVNMVLTYSIYGGFFASREYKDIDFDRTVEIISRITEHMVRLKDEY